MRITPLTVSFCLTAASAVAEDQSFSFKSPSGNILCSIVGGDDPGVRCDMLLLTQSYTTRPEGCDFDWGHSFHVGASASTGELACVNDALGVTQHTPVLPYEARVDYAGITCVSERAGVTCDNMDGHGFTLSKAQQQIY